jgi:hypothetical protein
MKNRADLRRPNEQKTKPRSNANKKRSNKLLSALGMITMDSRAAAAA